MADEVESKPDDYKKDSLNIHNPSSKWGSDNEDESTPIASASMDDNENAARKSKSEEEEEEEEEEDQRSKLSFKPSSLSFTSFGLTSGSNSLIITVTDPQKHGEGVKDAFVTYEVRTKTMLDNFSSPDCKVRRRYKDFWNLKEKLHHEYPACIIPPLPEKHRSEYLDRFSCEFIERRRVSLARFMNRLSVHPVLSKSEILRSFLERDVFSHFAGKQTSVLETFTDAILNTFSKVQNPDERFIILRTHVRTLEEHFNNLHRIQSTINTLNVGISNKLIEFAAKFSAISEMEPKLHEVINSLSITYEKLAEIAKEFADDQELYFDSVLSEYVQALKNCKITLKNRDQRQIDVEDLTDFLRSTQATRSKVAHGSGSGSGLSGFINKKIDSAKGISPEVAKREKLRKLDEKIRELETALQSSTEVSSIFNEQVVKEFEFFDVMRSNEMKTTILNYAKSHVNYNKKSLEHWRAMADSLSNSNK